MGIDGTTFDIPDTPANERIFGRGGNRRSPNPFPQVRVLALCELGTIEYTHDDPTGSSPPNAPPPPQSLECTRHQAEDEKMAHETTLPPPSTTTL